MATGTKNPQRKGLMIMKVLLIKDVYKLGHAGEVKRVADGYGRNYLLPQGMAVLATPGALKQVERIRDEASVRRQELNQEMSGVAEKLADVVLSFPARASETGKLYGSVTTQMIADALSDKAGVEIARRQIDAQPIRTLGDHKVNVRLTVDLVPEIIVTVYREGEALPREPGELPETLDLELEDEESEEMEEPEAEAESPEEPAEPEESDVVIEE
jgi:large subunit ribosomal protein L9